MNVPLHPFDLKAGLFTVCVWKPSELPT